MCAPLRGYDAWKTTPPPEFWWDAEEEYDPEADDGSDEAYERWRDDG